MKLGLMKRSRRASTGLKLRRAAIRECIRRLENEMEEEDEIEDYEEIIEWITKSLGGFLTTWRKKRQKKKKRRRTWCSLISHSNDKKLIHDEHRYEHTKTKERKDDI